MSYAYDPFNYGDRPSKPRPPVPTFVGTKLVRCKACGTESLRWAEHKTKKALSGSPALYLCESFHVIKYGRTFTNYRPHFKSCAALQAENAANDAADAVQDAANDALVPLTLADCPDFAEYEDNAPEMRLRWIEEHGF
jgi:hypothetical protein